ncbi:MAG: hypothetical protein ACOX47_03385 [Bacillota bacterium]|jgi:hypothetical protein
MMLMYMALIYSAVIEIPQYAKRKAWKEMGIYLIIWLLGLAASLYMSLDLKRPFLGEILHELILKMFPFLNSL